MVATTCVISSIIIIITETVALQRAFFGSGSGSILMDDVECTGSELTLTQCTYLSSHNCGHYEDASVQCISSE